MAPSPELLKYVEPNKVPLAPTSTVELRASIRPLGLNYWLRDLARN
jgi:hypothetical protein